MPRRLAGQCVEVFSNYAPPLHLITAVIVEQNDEWLVCERRYLSQESMDLLRELALNPAAIAIANVK